MVLTASSYPNEDVQQITADMSIRDTRYFEIYAGTTRLAYMPRLMILSGTCPMFPVCNCRIL